MGRGLKKRQNAYWGILKEKKYLSQRFFYSCWGKKGMLVCVGRGGEGSAKQQLQMYTKHRCCLKPIVHLLRLLP